MKFIDLITLVSRMLIFFFFRNEHLLLITKKIKTQINFKNKYHATHKNIKTNGGLILFFIILIETFFLSSN